VEQTEETSVLESGFHPNETVLLVEDESVIRTAVVEFLSSNGYDVLSAYSLIPAGLTWSSPT
jgi:DNA-binding NtrC family response regulator